MVKVNGKEVEWEKAPNWVQDVQRKVLYKDEQKGALFAIYRIPEGVYVEGESPHCHPHANQFTLRLSGEMELPDGTLKSFSEGDYGFNYCAKNEKHGGAPKGVKVLKDWIWIHYWDGPDDWGDKEGEE